MLVIPFLEWQTEVNADAATDAYRKWLVESGYAETRNDEEGQVFWHPGGPAVGPDIGRHELVVKAKPSSRGCVVAFTVAVPDRSSYDPNAGAFAGAFEAALRGVLREGVPFYEGVVRPDGLGITFEGPAPPFVAGPVQNTIESRTRAARWVYGLCVVVFGFFTVASLADFFTNPNPPPLLTMVLVDLLLGFFMVMGLVGLLFPLFSRSAPEFVAGGLDGVVLLYPRRPAEDVPWASYRGVAAAGVSSANAEPSNFMHFIDGHGSRHRVRLTRRAAQEVEESRVAVDSIGFARRPREFRDAFSARPGEKVLVAQRHLTAAEVRRYKLSRRWLDRGALVPVYITEEEAAARLSEGLLQAKASAPARMAVARMSAFTEAWPSVVAALGAIPPGAAEEGDAVYLRAAALAKLEKREEAERMVGEFLKRNKRSAAAIVAQGALHADASRQVDALDAVSRAVAIDPNSREAFELWFGVVARTEGPDVARAELESFVEGHPKSTAPLLTVGQWLHGVGKMEEAVAMLRKAFERDPSDKTAAPLAFALLDEGKPLDAASHLQEFAKRQPLGGESRAALAAAFATLGRPLAARLELEAAEGSDSPVAWRAAHGVREMMSALVSMPASGPTDFPYGRVTVASQELTSSRHFAITLELSLSPGKALAEVRRAFFAQGFAEVRESQGVHRFRRQGLPSIDPRSVPGVVDVRADPRAPAGTVVSAKIRGVRLEGRFAGAAMVVLLQNTLAALANELGELTKGKVAAGGTRVEAERLPLGVSFSPTLNTVMGLERAGFVGLIAVGAFALLVTLLLLAGFALGWHADPEDQSAARVFAALFGVIGVALLVAAGDMGVWNAPARGAIASVSGVRFSLPGRKEEAYSWRELLEIKNSEQTWGFTVVKFQREGATGRKVRKFRVGPAIASEMRECLGLGLPEAGTTDRQILEATKFVAEGTAVEVPPRLPDAVQLRARRQFVRYLPYGTPYPLVVDAATDAALIEAYSNGRKLEPPVLGGLMKAAVDREHWELATRLFEGRLKEDRRDPAAAVDYAIALERTGRKGEAARVLEDWIKTQPPVASVHASLAGIYDRMDRLQEATAQVARAAELEPSNMDALNLWVQVVGKQGEPAQALAEIDYFSTLNPNAWAPHLVVGMMLYGMGEKDNGRARVQRAFDLQGNPDTLHGVAALAIADEHFDRACQVIESALGRIQIGEAAALDLAVAYARRGETGRALEITGSLVSEARPPWSDEARTLQKRILAGILH